MVSEDGEKAFRELQRQFKAAEVSLGISWDRKQQMNEELYALEENAKKLRHKLNGTIATEYQEKEVTYHRLRQELQAKTYKN